mmetsp:Transcript_19113/g.46170  ORF Transcript_19113/g.46170 Transcript_19113/m.46170 type:complete len:108 (+) Transcript_19113:1034-1357(+)
MRLTHPVEVSLCLLCTAGNGTSLRLCTVPLAKALTLDDTTTSLDFTITTFVFQNLVSSDDHVRRSCGGRGGRSRAANLILPPSSDRHLSLSLKLSLFVCFFLSASFG